MFRFSCFTPDGESFSRFGGNSLDLKMFTDLGDFIRVENGPWRSRPVARRFFFFFFVLAGSTMLLCGLGQAWPQRGSATRTDACSDGKKGSQMSAQATSVLLLNAGLCFILQMFNRR